MKIIRNVMNRTKSEGTKILVVRTSVENGLHENTDRNIASYLDKKEKCWSSIAESGS
jgi:hypothetical protein